MSEEQQVVEAEAVARYKESVAPADADVGFPEGVDPETGVEVEAEAELIDGKFKSQEDLLEAYKQLEKKLSSGAEADKPADVEDKVEKLDADDTSSFKVEPFEREFAETGELSEASYKALEKQGFTKEQVDQYIEGKTYYAQSLQTRLYEVVGGEDSYSSMIAWAAENLDRGAIDEYNASLQSGDQARVKRNLEYMKFKMDSDPSATASSTPKRRLEGESTAGGIKPYVDKNEWQKAATNRLYGKDAKYTNMVDTRYLAARRQGIL